MVHQSIKCLDMFFFFFFFFSISNLPQSSLLIHFDGVLHWGKSTWTAKTRHSSAKVSFSFYDVPSPSPISHVQAG